MTAFMILVMLLGINLERPHLTIAQGLVESGLNPYAQSKNGKRFGYKGAYQIISKEWGPVPKTLRKQAYQAENVLNVLLEESDGDLMLALEKYNCYKNTKAGRRYAEKVRRKAFEIALLEVV